MNRYSLFLLLALAVATSFLISVGVGPAATGPRGFLESLAALFGRGELHRIVIELRLPRAVMAVLTGACLGISGAILQTVSRNPLASPYTFGVSASASFGAALAIIMGAGVTGWLGRVEYYVNPLLLVANSVFFAVLSCAVISILSAARGYSPTSTVLLGVSMTFLFTAATSLIECFGTSEQVAAVVFWMFGDLSRSCWLSIASTSVALATCLGLALAVRTQLDALLAGEEVASSLGVRVGVARGIGVAVSSILVAIPTAFVGTIGFLGLVAPHVARKLVGGEVGRLVVASGLVGAAILPLADAASRALAQPMVIPVGVLTSFLGVPLLIYLALSRGRAWS